MQLLDAPSREVCTITRPRTNTPGAALLLMNGVQFVEAARKFAERILIAGGDSPEACLEFAYRTALSRSPMAAEYTVLEQMLQEYRAAYEADASLAAQLMRHGDAPANLTIDTRELAAWTMIASTIMNLDETISQH